MSATGASSVGREQRQASFARHVEPQLPVLLRVAYTLTGSWADAEDLVQDTVLRAYRALHSFDGQHPRAWLLTILRNANISAHRRCRPGLLGDLDPALHRPAFGAVAVSGPEEQVVERELAGPLHQVVAELDEQSRVILLLVDVDQLSYAEVADVVGLKVGTVASRLSRARSEVRRKLADHHSTGRTR